MTGGQTLVEATDRAPANATSRAASWKPDSPTCSWAIPIRCGAAVSPRRNWEQSSCNATPAMPTPPGRFSATGRRRTSLGCARLASATATPVRALWHTLWQLADLVAGAKSWIGTQARPASGESSISRSASCTRWDNILAWRIRVVRFLSNVVRSVVRSGNMLCSGCAGHATFVARRIK